MKRVNLEAIKQVRKTRDAHKIVARPGADRLRKVPPRTSVRVYLP